jgi:hypothetical protein
MGNRLSMAPGYGRRLWSLIVLVLRPRPSSSTLSPLSPRSIDYEDEDEVRGRSGKMRVTIAGGHTPPKPRVDQNSFQSGPKVGCRALPILGLPAQSGPKVPEWTTIPPDAAPRPRRPPPAQGAHPPRRASLAAQPASKTTPGVVSHGQPRVPATSGTLKRRSLTPTRSSEEIWRPGQRAQPCSPAWRGRLAAPSGRPGLLPVLYHTFRHCQAITYNFLCRRNIRIYKHLRCYSHMAK